MPLSRVENRTRLPVRLIPGDQVKKPEQGIALCLSGGGYRALLFHVGSLWRMNELGLLPKLKRVSSVSGGSITAAFLGVQWNKLKFNRHGVAENFEELVVAPLRAFATKTIDIPDVVMGVTLPGSISNYIEASYRELFGRKTLQDLPDETVAPRFIINATNVQTTSLWLFSRSGMSDYRVGWVKNPKTSLAFAVAASSAFPPFLSPARLALKPGQVKRGVHSDLHVPPYTRHVFLSDGGVYDNLGLETCWKKYKTILVSDACAPLGPEAAPHADWARQSYRLIFLIQNEVQAVRKRQLIDAYTDGTRKGAYWGIASSVRHYPLKHPLRVPLAWSTALADTPTRLAAMDEGLQKRLINWGYAISDTALRSHLFNRPWNRVEAGRFPYPKESPGRS